MVYFEKLGAIGTEVDALVATKDATISSQSATLATQTATIASLNAKIAALTAPVVPASPSGQAMPTTDPVGWKSVYKEDFLVNVPIGGFVADSNAALQATNPYAKSLHMYPTGWKDSSKNGSYSPEKTASVSGSILDGYLHTENGVHYALAVSPQIPTFLYGRIDVRIKAPAIQGYKIAPLLWPNSNNWNEGEIDWPEIDNLGTSPSGFSHHVGAPTVQDQRSSTIDATVWHTYSIVWQPGLVQFFCDNVQIGASITTAVPSTPMHYVWQLETSLLPGSVPSASSAGHVQCDWIVAYVKV